MRAFLVLVCLVSLSGHLVLGISLPFRVPSFGVKFPGKVQSPPPRKSKLGTAFDKVIKLGGAVIDEHVAPVVDKFTPSVVKPYVASANRYVKGEWTAAKKEWAECKRLYGTARNDYEKIDRVITILLRNKYNMMKGTAVTYVLLRLNILMGDL